MLIFLNVMNPTNLTDLSDLTSKFRKTSTGSVSVSTCAETCMRGSDQLPFWLSRGLAVVAIEVDLRECTIHLPLQKGIRLNPL